MLDERMEVLESEKVATSVTFPSISVVRYLLHLRLDVVECAAIFMNIRL
jgi:hypothetical protein